MKGLKILTGALVVTLLTAVCAFAADGHELPWDNFGYRIATFILVLGIIWYAAGKKIVGFFRGRASGIEQELNDLEGRKVKARKSLADVEQRIANLESEREAILHEYRTQGERIKQSIIEKAETSAAQIREQAARTAQNELKTAVEEMRAEMADRIVEATEKSLAKKLSGKEHEELIDKYLTKVVLN